MPNVSFEISRTDIDNSTSLFNYSDFETYHTKRLEDGAIVSEGDVSLMNTKSHGNIIQMTGDIPVWKEAVLVYLNDHNSAIRNGSSNLEVKFVMTDMDDRFAFTYEKYVNGTKAEEGTGFYKDLETDIDREAWIDAAIEYKKANGIECDTNTLNALLDEINEKLGTIDSELPELNLTDIPLIEAAIPKLATDPCGFIPAVMRAGEVNISRINGVPNPTEVANYVVKILKDNAERAITSVTRAQAPAMQVVFNPVTGYVESDMMEHFRQLDAEHEEFIKTHSEAFAEFEVCQYNFEYNLGPLAFTEQDGDLFMDSYYEDSEYDFSEDSDYTYSGKRYITYDDMTVWSPKTYNGRTITNDLPPTQEIRNHINEFIDKLLNPLRDAWENYAKGKGWNPEWRITSGYRAPDYNAAVGGVSNSIHMTGYAADIVPRYPNNWDARDLAEFIYNYCKQRGLKFDQLLREISARNTTWVHIGYRNNSGGQRGHYYPYYYASASNRDPELHKTIYRL